MLWKAQGQSNQHVNVTLGGSALPGATNWLVEAPLLPIAAIVNVTVQQTDLYAVSQGNQGTESRHAEKSCFISNLGVVRAVSVLHMPWQRLKLGLQLMLGVFAPWAVYNTPALTHTKDAKSCCRSQIGLASAL